MGQSRIFNISSYAKNKVNDKRRRKGLGELTPRKNNPYLQIFHYTTTIALAKTITAPSDRVRIISQTRHMGNVASIERPTGSSIANLSKIVTEQGASALWRGNNINIYRNLTLIAL